MAALKAHVHAGRLIIDEPVEFPEGTVLELTVADPGDDLDDAERALLHSALLKAWESAQAERGRPADELIAKLRRER